MKLSGGYLSWKTKHYINSELTSVLQQSRSQFSMRRISSCFPITNGILASLIRKAYDQLGDLSVSPMITGSGGLTLAKHLEVPFVQEVISVSTALEHYAPQTDVAIELGGEDAKIIYFEGGNVEQRMNGICAGGTGSFIDQMASHPDRRFRIK